MKTAAATAEMYGERHPWAKLSDGKVGEILSLLDRKVRQVDIARRMGVTQGAISHINQGRRRRGFVAVTRKLDEVGSFVRSKSVARRLPEDPDDVYQTAMLEMLEMRAAYAHQVEGNPFNMLSTVAFRATNLYAQRERRPVSISEGAATGRVEGEVPACGHETLFVKGQDGETSEERFAAVDWERPEVMLSGEMERLRAVVEVFKSMDKKEICVLVSAMDDGGDLDELARRSKLGRARVARVIERFVTAVGDDPAVAHLRRVISAT